MTFPGAEIIFRECIITLLSESYLDMSEDQLTFYVIDKAKKIVKGGVDYFNLTVIGKLADDLEVFRVCRYVNPIWIGDKFINPNLVKEFVGAVTAVSHLKRFSTDDIKGMAADFFQYKREVSEFVRTPDEGKYITQMERSSTFWTGVHSRLPHLAKLARFCFSLTPSSAGAERVFSMLKNSFTINQLRSSLEDYTACSVMLQHNKKKNEKTFVINEEE